jgi:hypothetical protein
MVQKGERGEGRDRHTHTVSHGINAEEINKLFGSHAQRMDEKGFYTDYHHKKTKAARDLTWGSWSGGFMEKFGI